MVEDCQSCFATDLPIFNHPLLRVVAISVLRIVVARKVSFSYIVTKGEPEIVLIKHDSCSGNTTSKSGLWLGSIGEGLEFGATCMGQIDIRGANVVDSRSAVLA